MKGIVFRNPRKLVFGPGSFSDFLAGLSTEGRRRFFVLSIPALGSLVDECTGNMKAGGRELMIHAAVDREPSFSDLSVVLERAREFDADAVIGIGGGSVMDTAKLMAAMLHSGKEFTEVTGSDLLPERDCYLACVPSTSGTGSEVSPNAIFIDDRSGEKLGVISPHLVPDASCVDPELTLGLPPEATAATGMDAMTHCIEAFANLNAHPVVDGIALEGIRRIRAGLVRAVEDGNDLEARTELSLGSMYGGMCLGPVNTAAVHALAYPLGTSHKVAHGMSNAVLLPHVLRYNLDAAPERYARVAVALGAEEKGGAAETAGRGIGILEQMLRQCGLPGRLSDLGITGKDIDPMVAAAMQVRRLLKNNLKTIGPAEAREIYLNAL